MAEYIKVAELVLVKEGGEFVGMELPLNENVLNKAGAAGILDQLKWRLFDSSWVVNTVMRVEDKNAQANQSGSESGDTTIGGDGQNQEADQA